MNAPEQAAMAGESAEQAQEIGTVKAMQLAFYKATYQRYEILAPNIYLDWQFNEMDLLGVRRSGFVDEIEIKLSKSDFLADFRKTVKVKSGVKEIVPRGYAHTTYEDRSKHQAIQDGLGHCNYFSFLLPESLAGQCEIPPYAGLYIYRIDRAGVGRIQEVRAAKRLHTRKLSIQLRYEIGRKMAYRYWHA